MSVLKEIKSSFEIKKTVQISFKTLPVDSELYKFKSLSTTSIHERQKRKRVGTTTLEKVKIPMPKRWDCMKITI